MGWECLFSSGEDMRSVVDKFTANYYSVISS